MMKQDDSFSWEYFRRNLKNARIRLGMTQEKFSAALNIPLDTYGKVERGTLSPSVFFLINFSQYINKPIEYLVFESKTDVDVIWSMIENVREFDQSLIIQRMAKKYGRERCVEMINNVRGNN